MGRWACGKAVLARSLAIAFVVVATSTQRISAHWGQEVTSI
ncbi:MAG: hypothetical protein U0414_10645 [Polyangiaceae bacterium]